MQGVQQAPGTLKYISSRDTERSGDRLYRDAMHRQVKIRQLQVQRSEKQRQEEEREATNESFERPADRGHTILLRLAETVLACLKHLW